MHAKIKMLQHLAHTMYMYIRAIHLVQELSERLLDLCYGNMNIHTSIANYKMLSVQCKFKVAKTMCEVLW